MYDCVFIIVCLLLFRSRLVSAGFGVYDIIIPHMHHLKGPDGSLS